MERVDWTLDFEIKGAEREAALAQSAQTLAEWGLTMPPGDPLTIHFGLHDFTRVEKIEY